MLPEHTTQYQLPLLSEAHSCTETKPLECDSNAVFI